MDVSFKSQISAFIICKNEMDVIGRCIESLKGCREIVIVDSGSTDATRDVVGQYEAQGYPIRFIEHRWEGYAKQKQFALDQTAGPWCLSLDADERLDERTSKTLMETDLDALGAVGLRIRRRDYLPGFGYPPRQVHAHWLLRLVRKDRAHFDTSALVHEAIHCDGPVAKFTGGEMFHMRALTAEQEAQKMDEYSSLKALEKFARGRRTSFGRLMFAPLLGFLKVYVMQRYLLCGKAGFIYASFAAHYSFLTETKLYRLSLGEPKDL